MANEPYIHWPLYLSKRTTSSLNFRQVCGMQSLKKKQKQCSDILHLILINTPVRVPLFNGWHVGIT